MSWEAILSPPLLIAISALVFFSYLFPDSAMLIVPRAFVLILAIAFIFVTGKVYHLRARPSWNTPLVIYEYFTSAIILGLLGFAFFLLISGNMTEKMGQILGFLMIPFLVAELIITFAYRNRAMHVTQTARKALEVPRTKKLYFLFVLVGLLAPVGLTPFLILGIGVPGAVPAAFFTFLVGAVCWRVLFFRSATLIKITPDIAIQ
jgi:DMSO reductase anchor subunit